MSASSAGEAVTAIDFERSYNIVITYGDRFTVELGMPESLEYKLTYLDEVFAKLGEEKKGRIDLSKLMEKGVVYYYEN